MTDSRAALGLDRLPWLPDEPPAAQEPALKLASRPRPPRARKAKGGRTDLIAWAIAATAVVAGASYWAGLETAKDPPVVSRPAGPRATVRLPEPANPVPQVTPAPMPEVEPVAAPPMPEVRDEPRPAPKAERRPRTAAKPVPSARTTPKAAAKKAERRVVRKPAPLPLWPARVEQGAYGRLVRIGTFSSRQQAKKGWRGVVRVYPGMKRLPAVVVPLRSMRNGRVYYRLQMGTTSQAHSEVLCQRMRMVRQSCVVIGLPSRGGYNR